MILRPALVFFMAGSPSIREADLLPDQLLDLISKLGGICVVACSPIVTAAALLVEGSTSIIAPRDPWTRGARSTPESPGYNLKEQTAALVRSE